MKKLLLLTIFSVSAVLTFAQNVQVDAFFKKYEGKEGFTSVVVSEKLFALAASAVGTDPELQSVVDGIKGVRILVYENTEANVKSGEYYNDFVSTVTTTQFDELMAVNSATERFKLFGKVTSDKVIDELLLVCDADGEFVMVSIVGTIDIEKISKLSEMGIEGFDELEKIQDNK